MYVGSKLVNKAQMMEFFGDWVFSTEEQVREDIAAEFEITRAEIDRFEILLASNESLAYCGSIKLLLREKATGKLFEVNASHCSCHGYEGQFEPMKVAV